jgi:D-3-phosphoglycerate dehydrogenase
MPEHSSRTVLLPEPIEEEAQQLLLSRKVQIVQSPNAKPESVAPLLERADAVVLRTGLRMSAELIECGRKLSMISRTGAGYDNVDVEAATRQGVLVSSSLGANTHTVAEHTLALILTLAKQLPALDRETRNGNFRVRYDYLPRDLRGTTLGAVGFGRIGQEVARSCAAALGMRVLACDDYLPQEVKEREGGWVTFCSLQEVLKQADVLTIHVPFSAETKGLIGREAIARMKKGALVINTSRGGIIDEEALAEALNAGHLGGAGIDVFSKEPPPPGNPLLQAPSAVLTPHAAALTQECVVRMAVLAAERVLDLFDGLVPENVANPQVLTLERWRGLKAKALGEA